LYRESCLSGFCEDFKLNYIRQTYHNDGNKFLDGLGFIISGHLRKGEYITSQAFKNKGDLIFMIGRSVSDLSGSVFQMVTNNGDVGHTPPVDLTFEKRLVSAMAVLHQRKLIASACNVSRGGLFSALTDCALAGSLGFDITTDAELRSDAFLFNEAPGRVTITVSITNETQFIDTLIECDIPFSILGHVTKDELRIDDLSYGFVADIRQMMEHGWNTLVRG
jgi:phosphoribosylformylglycinamidine synthase